MLTDPERELILTCARQDLSGSLRERVAAILGGQLNWEETIATAWRHGVAPLLFRNVQSFDQLIAPDAMHLLRQSYVRASFRNNAHFDAIAKLLDQFAAAKVDLILLKGAALAPSIYHDAALRPFADIDLLVREREIDAAKEILLAAGYDIAPELLSEKFNRKYHVNLPFVRRGTGPVHIELHWKLTDPFSEVDFDHDALFERSRAIEIGQRSARALSLEDEFIYLAAHLDNHGYANRAIVDLPRAARFSLDELSGDRLIWFTDLHELISAGSLNWPVVIDRARAVNAIGALAVTLRLLRVLLGTDIADRIIDELPLVRTRWPEKKLGDYVLSLTERKDERIRRIFRDKILSTRKGFELRLVRLVDVWGYIFPIRSRIDRNSSYLVHVFCALGHCTQMFFELEWQRLLRLFRERAF